MMLSFFLMPYWWVVLPGAVLAMWAQYRLQSTFARYSQVGVDRGITGAQAAREILDRNGLNNVEIFEVEGQLTDHYDPAKRAVFLSSDNCHGTSVAAVGVAAHEVGHALQHKEAYGPLGLRMALVPITGFASQASAIIIMLGFFMGSMKSLAGMGSWIMWGGIGLFSLVVFFQLVTLPVEYDASYRAKQQLGRLGLVTQREQADVGRVLDAAALTYVAAMATAVLQLLQWILAARSRDDR